MARVAAGVAEQMRIDLDTAGRGSPASSSSFQNRDGSQVRWPARWAIWSPRGRAIDGHSARSRRYRCVVIHVTVRLRSHADYHRIQDSRKNGPDRLYWEYLRLNRQARAAAKSEAIQRRVRHVGSVVHPRHALQARARIAINIARLPELLGKADRD
jgi:hypothetical protein